MGFFFKDLLLFLKEHMQLTKQEHNHILRTQDLKLKMSNAKEITKEKQPVRRLVITVFYLWPHRTKSLTIDIRS